ncbi:MAG: hypothetical protein FWD23_09980 [Oscillospiraceae bacterium]|nr:hypothetical protein [Oscillospiraceae bacterium]
MKSIKKFPAVLAFFALFALLMFSCADKDKQNLQNASGDGVSPDQNGASDTNKDPAEATPELPDGDFGGAEFRLLLSGWSGVDFECDEESDGDRLNDAIYARNLAIEEKYKITIKTVNLDTFDQFGPSSDAYRKAARSGADEYDAFFGIQQYSLVDSMNSLNVEYNESLPYVDLNKPWWDSGILEVCYGDKVYFAAGDIAHSTLGYTTLLIFNKFLFNESGLDYPYQSVKDGTWTYDKFVGIIKDLSRDLDGDGKMDYRKDLFTIAGWQYEIPYNFHTVLGGNEVIKNKDGYPEIDIFSEKSMAAIDKILDLFSDYGGFYNNKNYGEDRNMFKDRRLYFLDVRMFEIERYDFRSMEDDFGMIPHPKLDLDTPYYTQLVNNNVVTVTTVPVTNSRLEMTSILLEALGYEGWKTISPEYKEVLLQTKLTRDNESADMFEYIWGHRTYRYGLEAFNNTLNANVIGRGDRAYVSTYEKLTPKAEAEIETIKEFFFN